MNSDGSEGVLISSKPERTVNFENNNGDGYSNLDPLDVGLLKELNETLMGLFRKYDKSWTKVGREHFALADANDRKAFITWVYGLQAKKLITALYKHPFLLIDKDDFR